MNNEETTPIEEESEEAGWTPSKDVLEPLTAEQEELLAKRKKILVVSEIIRWIGWAIVLAGAAYTVVDHLLGPIILIVGLVAALDRGKKCAYMRRKIKNPRD